MAIAAQLAKDGLTVLVSDLDEARAAETSTELRGRGLSTEPLGLDVSSPSSIATAFTRVKEQYGRCDVVVNNAGGAKTFPFLDFPLESFLTTMTVNVTGALLCSQHAARLMVPRRWGRIIASVAGMRSVGRGRTGYGTSKAAVIGLTRQMASELAELGISSAWPGRHSIDEGAPLRGVPRSVHRGDSDETLWRSGGDRGACLILGFGERWLHHGCCDSS